ncbi:hypothetical protein ES708_10130 [subsurface metagenome]
MEPKTFEEACRLVANEIAELVISKQNDYGQNNILDFGELGILVRTNDKVARLKNLIGKKNPQNETIEDTWKDTAGYAIVALMLKRGWFILPLG